MPAPSLSCRRRQARLGQGTLAFSELLSVAPHGAVASCTAAWNHSVAPEAPSGQSHGSVNEPTASVPTSSSSTAGKGRSTPHLKPTGVLPSATKSSAGLAGAAPLSVSPPGLPGSSRPVPESSGTPSAPPRPEPRLVHVPCWLSRIETL